jgi:hypothetical protein
MYEASVVMENSSYDPNRISRDHGFTELLKFHSRKGNHHLEDDVGDHDVEMTPENFDDWRLGGESQANTQSETENFSYR